MGSRAATPTRSLQRDTIAFGACDEENRYGGAMPMEGGRIILLGRSGENADC